MSFFDGTGFKCWLKGYRFKLLASSEQNHEVISYICTCYVHVDVELHFSLHFLLNITFCPMESDFVYRKMKIEYVVYDFIHFYSLSIINFS